MVTHQIYAHIDTQFRYEATFTKFIASVYLLCFTTGYDIEKTFIANHITAWPPVCV